MHKVLAKSWPDIEAARPLLSDSNHEVVSSCSPERGGVRPRHRSSNCKNSEGQNHSHHLEENCCSKQETVKDNAGITCSATTSSDSSLQDKRPKQKLIRYSSFFWICTYWIFSISAVITLATALAGAYWLALHFGYFADDTYCPVQDWHYPWCAEEHLDQSGLPPANTPEQWFVLRQKYLDSLAEDERSSLASKWDELYKRLEWNGEHEHNHGFVVPIEIKQSPNRGRGIFTKVPLKKGDKIWDNRYRGVFPSECSAKQFFSKLNNQEACAAMLWGYVNNFYGNGYQYMLDMDPHVYINHAGPNDPDRNTVHYFQDEMDTSDYRSLSLSLSLSKLEEDVRLSRNVPGAYGLYADRDIEAGDGKCSTYCRLI